MESPTQSAAPSELALIYCELVDNNSAGRGVERRRIYRHSIVAFGNRTDRRSVSKTVTHSLTIAAPQLYDDDDDVNRFVIGPLHAVVRLL